MIDQRFIPFDRGPIDLYHNGERTGRYGRAIYDGETLRVWAEWKLGGPQLIYQAPIVPDSFIRLEKSAVSWTVGEDTYGLTKASGCGCNYRGLSISKEVPHV